MSATLSSKQQGDVQRVNEGGQEGGVGDDDISGDLDSLRTVLGYNPNEERDEEQQQEDQYDVQYEVYNPETDEGLFSTCHLSCCCIGVGITREATKLPYPSILLTSTSFICLVSIGIRPYSAHFYRKGK